MQIQEPSSFDWDDDNEAIHVADHGIPFGIAIAIFDDPARIETEDKRPNKYNERRWNCVGLVDGLHINVTFAMDGDIGADHFGTLRTSKGEEAIWLVRH